MLAALLKSMKKESKLIVAEESGQAKVVEEAMMKHVHYTPSRASAIRV